MPHRRKAGRDPAPRQLPPCRRTPTRPNLRDAYGAPPLAIAPAPAATATAIPPPAFLSLHALRRHAATSAIPAKRGSALVPLGVLGVPGRGLADAYGGPNRSAYRRRACARFRDVPAGKAPFAGTSTGSTTNAIFAAPREACTYCAMRSTTCSRLRRAFSDTQAQLNSSRTACGSACAVVCRWAEAHPMIPRRASAHRRHHRRAHEWGAYGPPQQFTNAARAMAPARSAARDRAATASPAIRRRSRSGCRRHRSRGDTAR